MLTSIGGAEALLRSSNMTRAGSGRRAQRVIEAGMLDTWLQQPVVDAAVLINTALTTG